MMLAEWQVDVLQQRIDNSGLTRINLKEELLDHLCCCVEELLCSGSAFEPAIEQAFQQVCPDDPTEIEKQLVLLLNQPSYQMKKITYGSGLLSSVAMIIGILLKFFHWTSSASIFVAGLLLFLGLFLPLLLFLHYRLAGSSLQRSITGVGMIGSVAAGVGVSFKLLHYPGADLLVFSGAAILTFAILPFLFYRAYKNALN